MLSEQSPMSLQPIVQRERHLAETISHPIRDCNTERYLMEWVEQVETWLNQRKTVLFCALSIGGELSTQEISIFSDL
jgi:hypothetical protein